MNTKVKLAIIWGAVITIVLLAANAVLHLFANRQNYVVVTNGFHPRGRGHHGGFGPHPGMNIHHYGEDFSWMGLLLFLMIGLAVLVLLVRWLRKKSKTSAMQQLIETPLAGSHTKVMTSNAMLLDRWEKNLRNKKENQ